MDAKTLTTNQCDVLIAGGGLVGALTALMVARNRPDLRLGIVEPQQEGPAQDKRTIALAAATVGLLEQLDLWPTLSAEATAIEHIHVSDRGYFGTTRLHAEEHGLAALGQVVAAARLNQALYDACLATSNIEWLANSQVVGVTVGSDFNQVHVKTGDQAPQVIDTKLVVGADGQRSQVREAMNIAIQATNYDQQGIIATLKLAKSLNGWAYERFTETGPIALLPLPEQQASLVWSLRPEHAEEMMHCPPEPFLRDCQQAFGYRAGKFTAVQGRISFPLALQLAERSTAQRAVIIGNASHALHPIAGQGFNLGVRDAVALASVLKSAKDVGSYATLSDYWQLRERDYHNIIQLTDGLVRGFSNHVWPMNKARNLALLALDAIPPLKTAFAEQTMGFSAMSNLR